WVEADVDIIGRIVNRPEVAEIHLFENRLHQVFNPLRFVSVNAVLVLVDQANSRLLGQLDLVPHPVEHIAPPVIPDVAFGKIVAEDANVARVEDLAQLDCPLEALQMRSERLIDPYLSDCRANGTELEPVLVQQRLQLPDLQISEIEHVRLVYRAQFNMADTAGPEHIDLHLRIRVDLIGEGT